MFKAPENRNAARMAQAIHDIHTTAPDAVNIHRALEIKRLWNDEGVQRDLTKINGSNFRAWLARIILG